MGMSSGPVVFLGFEYFVIRLLSFAQACGKSKRFIFLIFSLILIMLGWFS